MSRDKTFLIKRNHDIKEEFEKLYHKKTYRNKPLYNFASVMDMLSTKYYLSSDYIAKLLNQKCECETCIKKA